MITVASILWLIAVTGLLTLLAAELHHRLTITDANGKWREWVWRLMEWVPFGYEIAKKRELEETDWAKYPRCESCAYFEAGTDVTVDICRMTKKTCNQERGNPFACGFRGKNFIKKIPCPSKPPHPRDSST